MFQARLAAPPPSKTILYFPSGLPSAPRDLVATSSGGKLLLTWSPPEETGGRSDITYSVECQHCEGPLCLPCGDKVRYEPASAGLTEPRVAVSDLEAHLNYTFTVEVHSGVSLFVGQANKAPPTSALTTSMLYTGGAPFLQESSNLTPWLCFLIYFFFAF